VSWRKMALSLGYVQEGITVDTLSPCPVRF
jgi:hypothetical protein